MSNQNQELDDFKVMDSTQDTTSSTSGSCGTNVKWKFDSSNGQLTISGTGAMADYSYSEHIPWKEYAKKIKSVVIASGVTTMGNYTLWNCQSVTNVEIADTVKEIHTSAFGYCKSLTEVKIPASVTSIALPAFNNCDKMTTITVDDSNKSYCSKNGILFNKEMTNLICYPVGRQSVAYQIPSTVTSIENGAFTDCISLATIGVESGNIAFSSVNGILYNANKTKLIRYPIAKAGNSFKLPNTVTVLSDYAFYNCGNLTEIDLGDKLKSIGASTFGLCIFKEINLPDVVKTIGNNAFWYCRNLTSIKIPSNVDEIDYGTFWGCSSLASVTIPTSVKKIGQDAFHSCSKLKKVYYMGSPKSWNEISIVETGNENLLDLKPQYYGGGIISSISIGKYNKDEGNYSGSSKEINIGDTCSFSVELTIDENADLTFDGSEWSCSNKDAITFNTPSTVVSSKSENSMITYYISVIGKINKAGTYTVEFLSPNGETTSTSVDISNILKDSLSVSLSAENIFVVDLDGENQSHINLKVTATIHNPNTQKVTGIKAKLNPAIGMTLVTNQELNVGDLAADGTTTVTWNTSVPFLLSDRDYQYNVVVGADNAVATQVYQTTTVEASSKSDRTFNEKDKWSFSHGEVNTYRISDKSLRTYLFTHSTNSDNETMKWKYDKKIWMEQNGVVLVME
ncbi:cell surface protein [Lachnospiraceae bacterium TWA4]|nr:cell surface protein [Lachnospiraceae bacterium TWA4]